MTTTTGRRLTFAAALLALGIAFAHAATPVPSGKWRWDWVDPRGRADHPIRIFTYRPRTCDSRCPIVFVLHGAKRDGANYRDYWELLADREKVMVIAPEFTQAAWPKAASYNLGDVAEQADREKWAYSAIEHIFDEMRDGQQSYAIFGHSAGGQFVQRMAILRPDNRASVMVAANPGWYLMPEWRKDKGAEPYPYSLVNAKVGAAELKQALEKRFILLVGEKDDDPDDGELNKSAGAMKQGDSRIDRGENFFKAATAAAQDLGAKLAWEFSEVPDTAHDAAAMSRAAAQTMFTRK
jgi:pimeloyl-ACP methyl ester carboxylesterase